MDSMIGFGVGLLVLLIIAFLPGRSFRRNGLEEHGTTPGEQQLDH